MQEVNKEGKSLANVHLLKAVAAIVLIIVFSYLILTEQIQAVTPPYQ